MGNSRAFDSFSANDATSFTPAPSPVVNEALSGLQSLSYNQSSSAEPPAYLDFGPSGAVNEVAAVGAAWAQMDNGTDDETDQNDSPQQQQQQQQPQDSQDSGTLALPGLTQMLASQYMN